mmetsp:Transcript_18961/g.60618  ORF Transcript_18961/g.60618 Transcript_18961/m.60618 type:complete len:294 (-) Transcript_18961:128-1009(-)
MDVEKGGELALVSLDWLGKHGELAHVELRPHAIGKGQHGDAGLVRALVHALVLRAEILGHIDEYDLVGSRQVADEAHLRVNKVLVLVGEAVAHVHGHAVLRAVAGAGHPDPDNIWQRVVVGDHAVESAARAGAVHDDGPGVHGRVQDAGGHALPLALGVLLAHDHDHAVLLAGQPVQPADAPQPRAQHGLGERRRPHLLARPRALTRLARRARRRQGQLRLALGWGPRARRVLGRGLWRLQPVARPAGLELGLGRPVVLGGLLLLFFFFLFFFYYFFFSSSRFVVVVVVVKGG